MTSLEQATAELLKAIQGCLECEILDETDSPALNKMFIAYIAYNRVASATCHKEK